MSSDSGPQEEVEVYAETVTRYPTYSAASIASCRWVNAGTPQIDTTQLELYTSRLSSSVAYGKIVGVGVKPKPTSPVPTPYVRLDMDNEGKGIHFNATQYSDSSRKLAAVIEPTVGMTQAARTALYLDYLKGIENRSAQFIWQWWSTGQAPS